MPAPYATQLAALMLFAALGACNQAVEKTNLRSGVSTAAQAGASGTGTGASGSAARTDAPTAVPGQPCNLIPNAPRTNCFDETLVALAIDTSASEALAPKTGAVDEVRIDVTRAGVTSPDACLTTVSALPDDRGFDALFVQVEAQGDDAARYVRAGTFKVTCSARKITLRISGLAAGVPHDARISYVGHDAKFYRAVTEAFAQSSTVQGSHEFAFNTATDGTLGCPPKAAQADAPCYEGTPLTFITETPGTPLASLGVGATTAALLKISKDEGVIEDAASGSCLDPLKAAPIDKSPTLTVSLDATANKAGGTEAEPFAVAQIFRYRCNAPRVIYTVDGAKPGLVYRLHVGYVDSAGKYQAESGPFTASGVGTVEEIVKFKSEASGR